VASSLAAQRASRAERDRLPTGSPKGERGGAHQRAGEFRHHLHPAFLTVVLFENVFLSGGDERDCWIGELRLQALVAICYKASSRSGMMSAARP
jgi:hypothetical protein